MKFLLFCLLCVFIVTEARRDIRCLKPIDKGPCLALIQRWAYDNNANKCVKFVYGGCQGNENNFETEDACKKLCVI